MPNYDNENEVINGEDTYQYIAENLLMGNNVLIGWTDEDCTHVDILFTPQPFIRGNIQRGLHRGTHIFVSIMGWGAFGFLLETESNSTYIAEKFNCNDTITTVKLAELINGVRKNILDKIMKG